MALARAESQEQCEESKGNVHFLLDRGEDRIKSRFTGGERGAG